MAGGIGLGPLAKGVWNLEKSENFDEYMKTVGVGYATRLVANAAKPKQEIGVIDNRWKITTTTTFTKVDLDFELDTEFDETTADGRKVKSTCRVEGNKLIIEQKGKINSTIVREFTNDSMVMSLTANNVTCKRYYKKEKPT